MGLQEEITNLHARERAARAASIEKERIRSEEIRAYQAAREIEQAKERNLAETRRAKWRTAKQETLETAFKRIEAEKFLKDIRELWGAGEIDPEPKMTLREIELPDFDRSDLYFQTLMSRISYKFPYFQETGDFIPTKTRLYNRRLTIICTDTGDHTHNNHCNGYMDEFSGYEHIFKPTGWEEKFAELSISVGVMDIERRPGYGDMIHQDLRAIVGGFVDVPAKDPSKLNYIPSRRDDYVTSPIKDSYDHIYRATSLKGTQHSFGSLIAAVYLELPHPKDLVPNQDVYHNYALDLTTSARSSTRSTIPSSNWLKRFILG